MEACGTIDGAAVGGFEFRLTGQSDDARHWDMTVVHEEFGEVRAGSSVEFARRPLALAPERLSFVRLQVHGAYEIKLPVLPVIAEPEACAEKLARYRRTALARDLYDLNWFADRVRDEQLVRRLWVLKLWHDVLDDGRGKRPVSPLDILTPRRVQDFKEVAIGTLTYPVDLAAWEEHVRSRFAFLAELDADELRWVTCDHRHRDEVDAALSALGS